MPSPRRYPSLAQSLAAPALLAAALLLAVPLSACNGVRGREEAACTTPQRRPTSSGFCVPRWLSLKSNEVLARTGPGFDYPAQFTYHARGLPVQVVAETAEWRRVCVPEGGAVWVHKSMVDGRRMVMSRPGGPTPLLARPLVGARLNATLSPSALAGLDSCDHGWCQISAGGETGWAPEARLWGTASAPQCR